MSLKELAKRLGFRDESLLERALTHSSYAHEEGRAREDNERLEFMGDAVVQLAVTERLYQQFPDRREGELAKMRASVVCAESLAEAARRLCLGEHLLLGKGEEQSGGRERVSVLGDAFEAVAAALYLDSGWDAARKFVLSALAPELAGLDRPKAEVDPKSALQERLQALSKKTPTYRLVSESGPDHDKVFVSEVLYEGKVLGRGTGRSKKESEQEAARQALKATEEWR
ncbi:MAG: ribonuclease III [Firmicutes bacterium]|nr:ribonuclease III [Bacillota bacterium]MBO2520275.1 ribonuclease III [Bacillota bacterium]